MGILGRFHIMRSCRFLSSAVLKARPLGTQNREPRSGFSGSDDEAEAPER